MRAEVDEEHRSQRWVNARRPKKFLGHSSSAEPSLQAGNVSAADYAESTEVGDETRYVTDARARYGSARWGDWVEERFRTFRLVTPYGREFAR